jgi:hypothetical protein
MSKREFYVIQCSTYDHPDWFDESVYGPTEFDYEGHSLSSARDLLKVYLEDQDEWVSEFNKRKYRIVKRTIIDEKVK